MGQFSMTISAVAGSVLSDNQQAGVLLDDLLRLEDRPLTLFDVQNPKSQALMTALDQVNRRFGKKTMVLASEGMKRPWSLRSDHRSPRYTTRLSDLPVVR
ncbi:DUF4113 domain-containing protein [Sedimentitalea nanhaiensis]|uniref:DNA polymerase V n=1 Tax=Sedimentitalea nanhaiensis TaxID=999627 RepID=A0A1I7CR47_9RHOB|nr:DUF4113 domain-containing protein [Sedimentitalea nanhaiensis]SFU01868.1 DNA polymerase V [Sedimentitalea nanhaiensis]